MKGLLQRLVVRETRGKKFAHASELSVSERRQYDEFRHLRRAKRFRQRIRTMLGPRAEEQFLNLYQEWEEYGLMAFRDFVSNTKFRSMVAEYDRLMRTHASKSGHAHTFLDLRDHPAFFANTFFRRCFLHPLQLLLLCYRSGRPVVLVDARSKDTGAIEAINRDNGPHMDDSWANVEQKIFVAWSKTVRGPCGEILGPLTQPFVALARSQHLLRLWHTEFGANFSVQDVRGMLANRQWSIFPAEFRDPKPVTILFGATRLLHHRFRSIPHPTETFHRIKLASLERSVCILAFHPFDRSKRWHGFFAPQELRPFDGTVRQFSALEKMILTAPLSHRYCEVERRFLDILRAEIPAIQRHLDDMFVRQSNVPIPRWEMSASRKRFWLKTLKATAPLSAAKPRLSSVVPLRQLRQRIVDIMMYDIHQDADMKIYANGDEQRRKYMRTRLRELSQEQVKQRLDAFHRLQRAVLPVPAQVLSRAALQQEFRSLLRILQKLRGVPSNALARRDQDSMIQLTHDLIECVGRPTSLQEYRTYSLFGHRVADEVLLFLRTHHANHSESTLMRLDASGQALFQHYLALVAEEDATPSKHLASRHPVMRS